MGIALVVYVPAQRLSERVDEILGRFGFPIAGLQVDITDMRLERSISSQTRVFGCVEWGG